MNSKSLQTRSGDTQIARASQINLSNITPQSTSVLAQRENGKGAEEGQKAELPAQGFAIAGFVLGIISLLILPFLAVLPFDLFGFILAVIGLVLCSAAKKRGNKGIFASAGFILCLIMPVIFAAGVVLVIGAVSSLAACTALMLSV